MEEKRRRVKKEGKGGKKYIGRNKKKKKIDIARAKHTHKKEEGEDE